MAEAVPEEEICADDVIAEEELIHIIKKQEKTDKISIIDRRVKPGSKFGDGFIALIIAMDVDVLVDGKKKTWNFMCKTTPKNKFLMDIIRKSDVFAKEGGIYVDLLPSLQELQTSCGIKGDQLLKLFPKCYYANHMPEKEVIMMENLKLQGYRLGNRKTGLDEDHIRLVLTALAKFHATGYAFKNGDPNNCKVFECLKEAFFKDNIDAEMKKGLKEMFFEHNLKNIAMLLKTVPNYEQKVQIIEYLISKDAYEVSLAKIQPVEPLCTTLHGDCWVNNFLFKYPDDDPTKSPTDVKLLDLQVARYGSPALDLAYFFCLSIPFTIIRNKFDEFLSFYHDNFHATMKQLKFHAPEYTIAALKEEWKRHFLMGFIFSLIALPMMLGEQKDIDSLQVQGENMDDVKKEMDKNMKDSGGSLFKGEVLTNRIVWMIDYFVDEGLLPPLDI